MEPLPHVRGPGGRGGWAGTLLLACVLSTIPAPKAPKSRRRTGNSSFHVCCLWGPLGVPNALSLSIFIYCSCKLSMVHSGQSCYPDCTGEKTALQEALWPAKGHAADSVSDSHPAPDMPPSSWLDPSRLVTWLTISLHPSS